VQLDPMCSIVACGANSLREIALSR
jgi:hypothetical protein